MAAQGELPPTQGQKIENSEPEQKAVQLPAGDQTTTTKVRAVRPAVNDRFTHPTAPRRGSFFVIY